MNKEQIENIIKHLENRGYEVMFKTYTDNSVSFHCNEHTFSINYEGSEPVVDVGIYVDYSTWFDQDDVNWLNSITNHWEMYKYRISFSFTAKDESELNNILLHCIEYFQ